MSEMTDRPIKVLLIEDDAGDARLIEEMLAEATGAAFALVWADRLSAGLEHLTQGGIDIALVDLSLPDSLGLHTVVKIHSHASGVPMVVLSGLDDETVAVEALQMGAQDYLVKSQVDSHLLARSVRYAIERHRVLAELEQVREHQLQTKNQFLSHVSHELRSPLTAIHQFVTILLDGLAGDISSEQREYLEIGLRNVNRLRNMIDELLEVGRAEAGRLTVDPRCISLAEPIVETLGTLRPGAEAKGISLSADIPGSLPSVYADPARVRQILTHLTDNAIKFTPEGGAVTIRARGAKEQPGVLCVSVEDTGCGISPERTERIFERFYQEANTAEGSRKGLGLGLYISQELVTRHGGRIWVESQLGNGSVFSFTLPVFSLAKILAPIITENNRVRDSIALITVKLSPIGGSPSKKIGEAVHAQARDVVQRCIHPDLDVLLPRTASTREDEISLVVGCTDWRGAEAVVRRIRDQLGRCQEFQGADVNLTVSATMIETPSQRENTALERLVEEIAAEIGDRLKTVTSGGGDGDG
ncbi:MAG: HAMP domain-containing histidine kinase [Candidatus Rokubacteria bacterium]|nr:HAMP domain-containing histidine kinase [Candidatus Rokubacteria bacterium]